MINYLLLLTNNPYWGFTRGVFTKWKTLPRPYSHVFIGNPPIPIELSETELINLDAWVYSIKIKIEIEIVLGKKGKKDYPACAAACFQKREINLIALNHSHQKEDDLVPFNATLQNAFQQSLGNTVGKMSTITPCRFPIGNCAEQRVANDIISYCGCPISDLCISAAFRPRTMTIIPPCENCKILFHI